MTDVYADLSLIDEPVWEAAIDSGHLFATLAWARSVERTFGSDRRYVIATDRSAVAAIYRADSRAYHFYNPTSLILNDPALQLARSDPTHGELAGDLSRISELAASDFAVLCSPYGFAHGMSAAGSNSAVGEVLDVLDTCEFEWAAAGSCLTYDRGANPFLAPELTRRGYVPLSGGANCVLPVPREGLPAYLTSLSKDGRRSARREVAAFNEHGLTTCETALSADLIPDLARLQAKLETKYGNDVGIQHEIDALTAIATHLGDYVRIRLTHKGDRLAGFELFYEFGKRWFAKMGGYDDTILARDDYAYFVAAYYVMLERAAERGISAIEYGPYAYKVKAQRGCVAEAMTTWVRLPPDYATSFRRVAALQRQLAWAALPTGLRRDRPPLRRSASAAAPRPSA